jgi:hypothetical protein
MALEKLSPPGIVTSSPIFKLAIEINKFSSKKRLPVTFTDAILYFLGVFCVNRLIKSASIERMVVSEVTCAKAGLVNNKTTKANNDNLNTFCIPFLFVLLAALVKSAHAAINLVL